MKNVNGWRFSPVLSACGKPTLKSTTGGKIPLNEVIAGSLESSIPQQQVKGRDIGLVIADALSSAGIKSAAFSQSCATMPGHGNAKARTGYAARPHRQARSFDHGSVNPGQFLEGAFQNAAGARNYRLYVPSSHATSTAAMPLVVMLHGCTQSPDDFAVGTRMNALAEQNGFLVLYPEQSANANGSNCWNWFRAEDQRRDSGEPSILAGMTRQIVSTHRVDPARVFVAGLSAGAAMAVILGVTYPDVFAAVGAHSGLAYGAAHDVPSAFAAMSGSGATAAKTGPASAVTPGRRTRGQQETRSSVPTIVFHGDQDHTVNAGNGAQIVQQAIDSLLGTDTRARACERTMHGRRDCSRIVHADASDRPVVEHWILHGAGHAWSGGDARGSYVDAGGPSASAEMIRFFLSQNRAATV